MEASVRGSARRRAAGVGLAALLLAAGAVGCAKGTEESPKMTPAAAVAEAAKKTEDITSFRYLMTGRVPEQGRVKAEAAMRMKPTVAMSMKMTALDQKAEGTAEIRLVDEAMYMGGSGAAEELDGKSWLKFDLSELGADGLSDPSLRASQADRNPAEQSTFLTGSKDVENVGTETVDGVETTHYKGTVTMMGLRESLRDEDDATMERRFTQFMKLGVDEVTMDMWVDGDDQTRQFRMRGDGDKGPLDMTITFLDINEPVTVEAPPAKDTMDLAEMAETMEGAES
jgi:hypothetical protein